MFKNEVRVQILKFSDPPVSCQVDSLSRRKLMNFTLGYFTRSLFHLSTASKVLALLESNTMKAPTAPL